VNCVHTIWLEGLPFQQVGRGVRDPELLTQGEALLQSVRLVALQKWENAPRLKAAHQAHVRLRQLSSEVGDKGKERRDSRPLEGYGAVTRKNAIEDQESILHTTRKKQPAPSVLQLINVAH
jgi:hypothetical protein